MPKQQVNCPNCRQPFVTEIEQLFDVDEDPQSKQRLLSGVINVAQCPHCGFQGSLPRPIVYHDSDKELLLTYFPSELSMPREEQERIIGPLINRIMDRLPQDRRKAYLLQPQAVLTFQGLVERVLKADGITKEMIQSQQERMNLLRRLLSASEESRKDIIRHDEDLIDADFFNLLARIGETALAGGDRNSAQQLMNLQNQLLEESDFGRQIKEQADELESAAKEIRKLGRDIDREKILNLVTKTSKPPRLRAYVQLVRPVMDYSFFQMLSERIDRARGKGRKRLTDLREKLLEYTQEVDQELEARRNLATQNLEALLQSEDVTEAMQQNLGIVDEVFLQVIDDELDSARKSGNIKRSGKLQQIQEVINNAMAPPPEIELINELIELTDDDEKLGDAIRSRQNEITPQLTQILTNMLSQTQNELEEAEGEDRKQQEVLLKQIKKIYNTVIRISMERSFKGS